MKKENVLKALKELRKDKKRKFVQTVDLIINLKNFDPKRQTINLIISLPYKVKEKKICAFLNKKSELVDTIVKKDFEKYKGKELKKLEEKYDFFISTAQLMPSVATSFGKVLGPVGKMPSPQLGILPTENDKSLQDLLDKINKVIKIRSKEPSLKISIGKEKMKDEDLTENALLVYKKILDSLPRGKENLKNILIKFTMSKPQKLEI